MLMLWGLRVTSTVKTPLQVLPDLSVRTTLPLPKVYFAPLGDSYGLPLYIPPVTTQVPANNCSAFWAATGAETIRTTPSSTTPAGRRKERMRHLRGRGTR